VGDLLLSHPKTGSAESLSHSPEDSKCDSLYLPVNILYVSQYFPPEMGAPAARAAELAQHWARRGHRVSVLTGFPNHPTGVVPEEWRPRLRRLVYRENIGGIDVFRTWLWPLPNRKSHERMRNYASFCISAALRGLTLPRPDVIIATSPQLLVGLAGWWLAFARQIPFVFEVRDLWPESLTAVGISNENSLLYRSLAALARFLYERADRIVVVSPAFRHPLVKKWHVPAEKIVVVENGVETDLFAPQSQAANRALRRELGADHNFLICYVGTMGNAHGLETLLDAACYLLQKETEVQFLLIGEGAEKDRIRSQAQTRGLTTVRFLGQQPREKIPAFISASDACLVLLKKTDVFKTVIPTKMLEFMSCARPVILAVEGEARQIVENADAGICIEPENSQALAAAITQLAENRNLGSVLGQNGRQYVLEHFGRRQMADKFIQALQSLTRS
jgi:colanic acid biosynthesis glycosyl transferase WcaI